MKTILITGANRGIGLELVKQYADQDNHVIATTRTLKNDALHQLAAARSNITIYQLDVKEVNSINALANELKDTAIDILINNAGIYGPKYIDYTDVQIEDWLEVMQVNCMAALFVARAFQPNLELGTEKKMAFISSKMGSIDDNGSGGSYIYRSSKTALNSVVKSLAIDFSHLNINAVALHPGWVLTDMGGPNALITVETSVTGLKRVIDNLTEHQSGEFINFDGNSIPW